MPIIIREILYLEVKSEARNRASILNCPVRPDGTGWSSGCFGVDCYFHVIPDQRAIISPYLNAVITLRTSESELVPERKFP